MLFPLTLVQLAGSVALLLWGVHMDRVPLCGVAAALLGSAELPVRLPEVAS